MAILLLLIAAFICFVAATQSFIEVNLPIELVPLGLALWVLATILENRGLGARP
jgi:hypothetical protein